MFCLQSDVTSRKRPETKAEKVSRAMESLKRMNTVIEAPLEKAITDHELQKKYPEAAKLLHDVSTSMLRIVDSSTEMKTIGTGNVICQSIMSAAI